LPVLLCVLSFAPSVCAQESDADLDRARALFNEAGELERRGKWPDARDRLRAALDIRETANLRYALGWALENDGEWRAARDEYETALRLAEHTNNEEVRDLASARLAEVDRVTSSAEPRPPQKGSEPKSSTPVLPWVLVGSGSALLVSGVLLFVASSSDASARDEDTSKWCAATACKSGVASRPETAEAAAFRRSAYDAANRGNTKQIVGGILGGLGAVGVGIGVTMLLGKRSAEAPTHTAVVRLDASPLAGGGMAGATFVF
jgi:tetratricopeptide (TPR) repeat protein